MIDIQPGSRIKICFLLAVFCCLLFPGTLPAQNKKLDSLLNNMKMLESKRGTITADTNLIQIYFLVADEYYKLNVEEKAYSEKALGLIIQMLQQPALSDNLRTYLLNKQAKAYGNMGNFYEAKNDFSKALEVDFKGLKIAESINNRSGMWRHYSSIANCYSELNEEKKALEYNFKALSLIRALNSNEGKALIYANIGVEYSALDSNEIALTYLDKGLKMFRELKDTSAIASALGNIAIAYTNLANKKLATGDGPENIPEYFTAVTYYKKAIELSEISGDQVGKEIQLANLGYLYMILKKYSDAKTVFFQSLALSEELGDIYGIMGTNLHLSELYGRLKDPGKSFKYYKAHIAAKDSIFNVENAKKNTATELNFEFEKKMALEKVENEKTVIALESEKRVERTSRNFIIILAVMLLLLVVWGFVYFNNRKALKIREIHSQQLLLSQEKERQRISKELHDSIGQNILFIKNQMIKNNDLRLMTSVDETLEEVRTISKDLYPNQLEKYGLIAAVDALAEKVKESSGIFVSYDLDAVEKDLSPDKLINYYRIIQECISNTLKHAGASALRITAAQVNDNIELIVQDNGKGFDKAILSKKSQQSFGLLNLEERVKYLKGKLTLETSAGKGTKYIFSIPS